MKIIPASSVALTALLHAVNANFDVYVAGIGGNGISGNDWGFQVYDNPPTCGETIDWIWRASDDVSGDKYGVRCKGSDHSCYGSEGPSGDPSGIQELEMNFNSDDYHWTTYADRDWGLFDLEGDQVGTCMPFPDEQLYCGQSAGQIILQRKIRCLIDSVDSEDIKSSKPK